jgi:hypothetical protein
MIPAGDNGSHVQDTTGGYWFQGTDREHEILWNVLYEAIDTGISRRETTNDRQSKS